MPDEVYDSFSASNPTIKIAVDTLRAAMNLKSLTGEPNTSKITSKNQN